MNDTYLLSDREKSAESLCAYYENCIDRLRERIDELEAQLFIAQADAALPLFEVMHLEPVPFPSITNPN